jgi:TfoX/Sxy family transcriptional regulator of competence genes
MHIFNRLFVVLFALAALNVMPGCVKYKQIITLMPDGSGKVNITMGVDKRLLSEFGNPTDPFALVKPFSPDRVKKDARGVSAFTKAKFYSDDGYHYTSYDAYFEDINQLHLMMNDTTEDGGRTEGLAYTKLGGFKYVRDGDTAKLIRTKGPVLSIGKAVSKPQKEDADEMIQRFKGIDISERYVMPGTFIDQKGIVGVDNTAILRVTLDDVLEETGPMQVFKNKDTFTIEINDITLDDEAVRAFREEMAAAVKAAEQEKEKSHK